MLFRLLAVAVTATLAAACLVVTTPAPSAAAVNLAELRRHAEKARQILERGTKAWEKGKEQLAAAKARIEHTRRELAEADRRLRRMSEPLAKIGSSAYRNPHITGITALLESREPRATMLALSDLKYVTKRQAGMVREAVELEERRKRLVRAARQLRAKAKAKERRLAARVRRLEKKSQQAVDELVAGMRELGLRVSRGGRLPLGCDASQAADAKRYPNGLIPDRALCALPQQGERLRADAAVAFYELNAAYIERFGEALCVTDSYRSLGNQQAIYVRKPGFAAVPGSSNHGKGISVDLCGGVERFGSVQYNWMQANAGKYGWMHPSWAGAGGSMPEPWHWNYAG